MTKSILLGIDVVHYPLVNDFLSGNLSTSHLAAAVLIVLTCIFGLFFYNLYLHPLSKYPGPKLWAMSRMPYAISLSTGKLTHDAWAIHDKYGKVVRMAPNELSFIDKQAWFDIYGQRGRGHAEFIKNPAWIRPAPNGAWSIIDAPEKDHLRQRKILSHAFSSNALVSQEVYVHKYTSMLIDIAREKKILDMKDWYAFVAFDITGDLTFGRSFQCLEKGKYHLWVAYLFSHLKAACLLASITFYPMIMNLLWLFVPKAAFNQQMYHFKKSVKWVHRRLAMETSIPDFMSFITRNNGSKTVSIEEIEATATTLIMAGSETLATVLTSTTLNLLLQPEKLAKLVQEIRSSFKDESEITAKTVTGLPYLQAVIDENFRYTPPVPCATPRIVPPGGDTICGEFYPGGTFVGVPQLPTNRYPEHFAHSNHFIPERWLSADSPLFYPTGSDPKFDASTFVNDEFGVVRPYSVGPRSCIAQKLARMQIGVMLSRILWNFDFEFPGGEEEREKRRLRPWVSQKTFALWVKEELFVKLTPVSHP
ncbi:isotrichodermin C-15 hydroxylase [Lepidopterella palustris CBS 459.81]|uniref:Isotrichodermin C-15 hydroxylase n=1 Tax=Lepidopterella palustris CBS 459.81 TaxID=1314670 RepID=A0A8E2JBT2_9PEZI|nr:isotrichodermin C-15 hydroxylase [Lepidopterella palustris CBS 459.81]